MFFIHGDEYILFSMPLVSVCVNLVSYWAEFEVSFVLAYLSVSQPSNFSSDTLFLRCRLFCRRIFLGVYSPERICHFYFFHPYSTIIFSMFSLCYRERVRDGGCFLLFRFSLCFRQALGGWFSGAWPSQVLLSFSQQ